MTKMTVEEIRAALVRGKVGLGRPYPETAREAVKELVAQRRREGAGLSSVARELGVSATTLRKWVRKDRAPSAPRTKTKFREVEVVPAPPASPTLIVHGPAGLRIEGVTIADVAELVRRLG
jgi:transposase-like protein